LRVSVLGTFRLATTGGVEIAISNRRARALLAMLCLAPAEPLDRRYVSTLLWPGRFPAQARASLRQCILSLDKALAPFAVPVLDAPQGRIAIDPLAIRTDLADLDAALAGRNVADTCDLLTQLGNRPLLDQMDYGPSFDAWLTDQRRHFESRLHAAVDRMLIELERGGDVSGRDRVRDAWRACCRMPVVAKADRPSIAILPFAQFDAIGEPFFLAAGVVDELTFRLGAVGQLDLVGRTSVANIVAGGGTLPAMAVALGATHVIEGEVHRFTKGVRVSLRLVDGRSGTEIWSDRYDGTVSDAIGSRHVIGSHFVAGLCTALGVEAPPAPARRMTANRDAYALYLQGRALTMRTIGDDVIANAIDRLDQALRIDPDFAECWAALAEAHLYSATFTPAADRLERAAQMAACARRAIALDPAQGHARVLLAVYELTRHNAVAALDLAFEARRLAPNDSEVAVRLGQFLLFRGRPRAALPHLEAAIDRDPVHGSNYAALCCAYLCLGDVDRAIAAGRSMKDLGFPAGPLAIAYAANGDHERAVALYYDFRLLLGTMLMPPPGMAPLDDTARDAYFLFAARGVCSGDPAARAAYCQMLDGLHQVMADPYDISIAYPAIYMGHAELVMKIYREQPNLSNLFGLMSLWSDVDPIRRTVEHPGFLAFAEQIGFVAAWDKYGWPERMPMLDGPTPE
jgi:DNA-binding SARP family transcriptional activator/TolB-like protein